MTDFTKAERKRIEREGKVKTRGEKYREKRRRQAILFSVVPEETLWEVYDRRRMMGRIAALVIAAGIFACLLWMGIYSADAPWYIYLAFILLALLMLFSLRFMVDGIEIFEKVLQPMLPEMLFFTNHDGVASEIERRRILKTADREIPDSIIIDGELTESDVEAGGPIMCVDGLTEFIVLNYENPENCYGIKLSSFNEYFREKWEPGSVTYSKRVATLRKIHYAGYRTFVSIDPFPALTYRGYVELYGFKNMKEDGTVDFITPKGDESLTDWWGDSRFDALQDCLETVRFVDSIYFDRWIDNGKMPTNIEDPDAWYREAAGVVRDFCKERGITCTIGEGIE